jgi:hypothetical protein
MLLLCAAAKIFWGGGVVLREKKLRKFNPEN